MKFILLVSAFLASSATAAVCLNNGDYCELGKNYPCCSGYCLQFAGQISGKCHEDPTKPKVENPKPVKDPLNP